MRTILAVILLCLAATAASAWPARVQRVIDGDTVEVRRDGQVETVRIAGIDAPERGQPGGDAARLALEAILGGGEVEVLASGRDRHGRTIARIERGGRDVGRLLVQAGHAWQFTRYDDSAGLRQAEQFARANGLGLWADPDALAPWLWRRQSRTGAARQARQAENLPGGCTPAPRCSQMTSCAQAMAALRQCGPGRLDGDRDGIPCESLCRSAG